MIKEKKCGEHGQEVISHCQWCAKSICSQCIEEAKGHKLCDTCANKLSREKPLTKRIQVEEVRNIDTSLSEEQIREARKYLFPKEEKKGPKIRNVPDEWPKLHE